MPGLVVQNYATYPSMPGALASIMPGLWCQWQQYGLQALRGQQAKFRFLMLGAKLYSYSLLKNGRCAGLVSTTEQQWVESYFD